MELYYKGRIRKLKEAVLVANKILKSEEFYNKISEKQFFDNTFPADLKAEDLAFLLKNHTVKIGVRTYIGSANAKTRKHKYFKINILSLNRTIPEIVNTMVHEAVHCVDFWQKDYEFTHVDNDNTFGDENNTAPWAIGRIAEELAKKIIS